MRVFASLWASRPLCEPWTSPTLSPLPNRSFPSLVHHPWASMYQPCMSFILHGNLASYRCLAPLAIILICWVLFKIIFVGFMGLLCSIYHVPASTVKGPALLHLQKGFKYTHLIPTPTAKGISITLPHLPYNTMRFDTTCWGYKHLGEILWIINITYKDRF